jgi:hypothetical protein
MGDEKMTYTVQGTVTRDWTTMALVDGWKVVAYNGPGVNFPVESEVTTSRSEAEDWCERANRGETVPEAKFASYSDD